MVKKYKHWLTVIVFAIFNMHLQPAAEKYSENYVNSEGYWRNTEDEFQDTSVYYPAVDSPTSRLDIGGLIGTVGFKKGASVLGLIVFPLLVPFVLALGFLVAIIFIIISITAASTGTAVSTGRRFYQDTDYTSNNVINYENVLDSDKCVERISCEIIKRLSSNTAKELIISVLQKLSIKKTKRISKAAHKDSCDKQYPCNWKTIVMNTFNVGNASTIIGYDFLSVLD